jgi:hypothetical protein
VAPLPLLVPPKYGSYYSVAPCNTEEGIVGRRYTAGLRNFFGLYQPLAVSWQMVDNGILDRSNVVVADAFSHATHQRAHKRAGHSVVSWENGQVVLVPPEDIPVDDDPAAD